MPDTATEDAIGVMPDLSGRDYYKILERVHNSLRPQTYFEIGVNTGKSFALSQCPSIGVDPDFRITNPSIFSEIMAKPCSMFFKIASDTFFKENNPSKLLGRPIEFAFLDGMHRCEFLLRDFINTEAHCRRNSVIALHDCLPTDSGMTARLIGQSRSPLPHRSNWWAGDVWRTSLLLKRRRPDLQMTVVDASPTGLVLITNLDPTSKKLSDGYPEYVSEMLSWSLDEIGVQALFHEMRVEPTSVIEIDEQFTARFWL